MFSILINSVGTYLKIYAGEQARHYKGISLVRMICNEKVLNSSSSDGSGIKWII